jgi:nucleoside-diphosphate-sugar epimerase
LDVLITGGAGFIGYHLAKYLSNNDYSVTILDNFARGRSDDEFETLIKRDNVKFIRADITESSSFESLATYDYIYHLAAINGTGNFYNIPDKVLRVGVLGTINILDWFVKQNKGKLLFSSSSETYAGALGLLGQDFPIPTPEDVPLVIEDPTNVRWSYGASKIIGEIAFHAYAKAHKMSNFSIIRYHNIYGPRMGFEHVIPQFIERIVNNEDPFTIYGGQETRTFCYIDDAVIATKMIMENASSNGHVTHVGRSDGEIKIIDLAKLLFEISSVKPNLKIEPPIEGSVMRRCPDVDVLSSLGFTPSVDLAEGLKKCYEWYETKY